MNLNIFCGTWRLERQGEFALALSIPPWDKLQVCG